MMERTPVFTCAICRHQRGGNTWNDRQMPPVCAYCEVFRGYGWTGSASGRSRMLDNCGAFKDRRIALQIEALETALRGEAHGQIWEASHGRQGPRQDAGL